MSFRKQAFSRYFALKNSIMEDLSKVEELFVLELLKEHADYIAEMLEHDIIKKDLRITEALIKSLVVQVVKSSDGLHLFLGFRTYGRFIEIQNNKHKKLIRNNINGISRKNKVSNLRRASKKDKSFYAKNVYGSLNRLIGRMQSGYSDIEIQRIKQILQTSEQIPSAPIFYSK